MTGELPRLRPWIRGAPRPVGGLPAGFTIEIRSRQGAIEAHRFVMRMAVAARWLGAGDHAAAWLTIAGELRCWAAGRSPRRRRRYGDGDPYPTVVETFPLVMPRWSDDA